MKARSLSSTPAHACSSSFTKAQHSSPFQWSELVVTVSNFCALDLLGIPPETLAADHLEQNQKDIPKQEEFSPVLQLYAALVDNQIELFGRLEAVIQIQDLNSRLVKTGLVIGDTQTQWPPCGSLHRQEA